MISAKHLAVVALCVAAPASANEPSFPPNLAGAWSGSGEVQKDDTAKPRGVRCTIEVKQSDNMVGFQGDCRAMMIFKRAISAEITRDGDRFTGVYDGAGDSGVAQLDGTMTAPNTLTLDMTFENVVNGDNKGEMIITHPDDDTLTIVTRDKMESGVEINTTEVTFTRG